MASRRNLREKEETKDPTVDIAKVLEDMGVTGIRLRKPDRNGQTCASSWIKPANIAHFLNGPRFTLPSSKEIAERKAKAEAAVAKKRADEAAKEAAERAKAADKAAGPKETA